VILTAAFTLLHVALSLVGILSGFVVLAGFLTAKRSNGWTALFLATTVLTSVTGFLFPFHKFLPSHAVGILYLNVFVLIAQQFMKVPALKALAPTQSEPPFLGAQVVLMLVFVVLGVLAAKRFPAEAAHAV